MQTYEDITKRQGERNFSTYFDGFEDEDIDVYVDFPRIKKGGVFRDENDFFLNVIAFFDLAKKSKKNSKSALNALKFDYE